MEPYAKGFTHPFFKPINFRDYRNYLPTAYDDSLGMYQQMTQVLQFCNEIGILNQDMANNWNMLLSWIETNGVDEAVVSLLNKWVLDGTMAQILDKTALKDINKKLDDLSALHNKDITETKQYINTLVTNTRNELNIKIDGNYNKLYDLITSIDASPKGSFNSLAELEAKYPNGATGIYLVGGFEDGVHIFYYDAGWKNLGSYQKPVIGAGSITSDMLLQDTSLGRLVSDGIFYFDETKNKIIFTGTDFLVIYRGHQTTQMNTTQKEILLTSSTLGLIVATIDDKFVANLSYKTGSELLPNDIVVGSRHGNHIEFIGSEGLDSSKMLPSSSTSVTIAQNMAYLKDSSIYFDGNTTFIYGTNYFTTKDLVVPTKGITSGFVIADYSDSSVQVVTGGKVDDNPNWSVVGGIMDGVLSINGLNKTHDSNFTSVFVYDNTGNITINSEKDKTLTCSHMQLLIDGKYVVVNEQTIKAPEVSNLQFWLVVDIKDRNNATLSMKPANKEFVSTAYEINIGFVDFSRGELDLPLPSNYTFDLATQPTRLYLGDSILKGFRTSNEATFNPPYLISKHFYHNKYLSNSYTGSTITSPQEGNSFYERSMNIDFSEAQTIVIFGGHNDYKQGKPLGDLQSKDEKTMLGSLNKIRDKIYSDNPTAKIVMITPNWRVVNENDATSTDNIDTWENSAGLKFKDYLDALNSWSSYNSVPTLNLYGNWGVNAKNHKAWLTDGLHPNDKGALWLAKTIDTFIKGVGC